jgi:Ca2+-transporting ATPase
MLPKPWAENKEKILRSNDVSADTGLTDTQVKERRRQFGYNRLQRKESVSVWQILISQFENLIVLLLALAGGASFLFGDWLEGVAILFALLINTAIGFFTEWGAQRSITALKQLSEVTANVLRSGNVRSLPAQEVVPGDIVILKTGQIICADIRLIESSNLKVNESALTGESMPVHKQTDPVDVNRPLAERTNMLYKGTAVNQGSAKGIVVNTGMDTELGRISSMVSETQNEQDTPLEKRLNQLGTKLIWITGIMAVMIVTVGLLSGREIFITIKTAIALMVAAIPEGLPIVATIALARGMWRMAQRQCLINRLSTVETLGSTTLICTDKTGTLTENQMTVVRYQFPEHMIRIEDQKDQSVFLQENDQAVDPKKDARLTNAIKIGMLCNNATLKEGVKGVGDPMEIALLGAAGHADFNRNELMESLPRVREEAFDPQKKMMATVHRQGKDFLVAVKGAPEAVIHHCAHIFAGNKEDRALNDEERQRWFTLNEDLANQGLRVLALATKTVEKKERDPYEQLRLIGLVALADPPRIEVKESIDACQDAGVRVLMVTGDQASTARYIGRKVGLIDDKNAQVHKGQDLDALGDLTEEKKGSVLACNIFARVSPRNKLDLVTLHQENADIVAMTGDGVNDAPALQKSNIGVAMGLRGTQVAKEAADMILKDDSFQTIIVAIAQGRAIFANIRKFIIFLLSGNMSEILVVAISMLLGWPLPLLPLQILYLNMIGDVFPALALGIGKGDPSYMRQRPRDPEESILTARHWREIGFFGVWIALVVMTTFFVSFRWFNVDQEEAVTNAFLTLAFSRILLVFNMKKQGDPILKNEITSNPYVWGAIVLCAGLLLLGVYVPVLSAILKLRVSGAASWFLITGMSLLSLTVGHLVKTTKTRFW